MPRSRDSFSFPILIALLAVGMPCLAAAQDMPTVFGSPDLPAAATKPAPASPAPVQTSPSAQATIAPQPVMSVAPVRKPQVAAVRHPVVAPHRHVATAAEKRKFAELMKKLALRRRAPVHHVVVHEVRPELPPGTTVAPPPGYYPPGPYARLVYGGPPLGPYGWGGYTRPHPYYAYP